MSIFNEDIITQVPLLDVVTPCLEYFGELEPDRNGDYKTSSLVFNRITRYACSQCAAIILDCNTNGIHEELINFKELFYENPEPGDFKMQDIFEDIMKFEMDEFLVPPRVKTYDFFHTVFLKIQHEFFHRIPQNKNMVAMGHRTYMLPSNIKENARFVMEIQWRQWGDKILVSRFKPNIQYVAPDFNITGLDDKFSCFKYNPGYIVEPVSLSLEFNLTLKN